MHSFSITFDDKEFDESAEQIELSRYLGTKHTALPVRHGDIARSFPDAMWHGEVPVFRTAFVPMFLLSRLVNEKGIKVVLTGEGSDESFLGYDIFKEAILREGFDAERDADKLRRLYPYLPHFNDANIEGARVGLRAVRAREDAGPVLARAALPQLALRPAPPEGQSATGSRISSATSPRTTPSSAASASSSARSGSNGRRCFRVTCSRPRAIA